MGLTFRTDALVDVLVDAIAGLVADAELVGGPDVVVLGIEKGEHADGAGGVGGEGGGGFAGEEELGDAEASGKIALFMVSERKEQQKEKQQQKIEKMDKQ